MTAPELITSSTTDSVRSTDVIVRPKVLRRPAHLSVAIQPARIAPARLELLPMHAMPPTQRAWQDDGRFALALLAIIIVLNLAVTAWLSTLHHDAGYHATDLSNESANTTSNVASEPVHVLDSLAARTAISQ